MPMCVLACWHGEPNDAVRWAPPTWRPQGNSSESLLSGRAPSVARIGAKVRKLSGEPDVGAHSLGHHRLLIFLLTVQADLSRDRLREPRPRDSRRPGLARSDLPGGERAQLAAGRICGHEKVEADLKQVREGTTPGGRAVPRASRAALRRSRAGTE